MTPVTILSPRGISSRMGQQNGMEERVLQDRRGSSLKHAQRPLEYAHYDRFRGPMSTSLADHLHKRSKRIEYDNARRYLEPWVINAA